MGCVKLFEDYLPKRPYHTDDLISGLKINKTEKDVHGHANTNHMVVAVGVYGGL